MQEEKLKQYKFGHNTELSLVGYIYDPDEHTEYSVFLMNGDVLECTTGSLTMNHYSSHDTYEEALDKYQELEEELRSE